MLSPDNGNAMSRTMEAARIVTTPQLALACLLAACCLSLSGCGGCSGKSVQRRALVGNPDDAPADPAAPAKPVSPAPAPAVAKRDVLPAATPAPTAPVIAAAPPAAPEIYPSD